MAIFSPIERQNAAEAVRSEILALIHSGRLKVGERLPAEQELARSFGVSRPVVREALGGLRSLGVVVSRNGRGSFVASNGLRHQLLQGQFSMQDLHEVRYLLEVDGAARAARQRTTTDIHALFGIVKALEAERDAGEWSRLDASFHIKLAEATGNGVLIHLVGHLRSLLIEQSQLISELKGRLPKANAEHRAIFEAVEAGSEDSARDAMSVHLLNAHAT